MSRFLSSSLLVAAVVMAGGVALSAGADPAPAGQSAAAQSHAAPRCLDIQNAGRKHVVNDHTLLVYDDFGNAFLLDIGGPCKTMDDYSKFGFEIQGSTQVCQAHDAMILYSHNDEPPLRCLINGVKPISKEDAKALDK